MPPHCWNSISDSDSYIDSFKRERSYEPAKRKVRIIDGHVFFYLFGFFVVAVVTRFYRLFLASGASSRNLVEIIQT